MSYSDICADRCVSVSPVRSLQFLVVCGTPLYVFVVVEVGCLCTCCCLAVRRSMLVRLRPWMTQVHPPPPLLKVFFLLFRMICWRTVNSRVFVSYENRYFRRALWYFWVCVLRWVLLLSHFRSRTRMTPLYNVLPKALVRNSYSKISKCRSQVVFFLGD